MKKLASLFFVSMISLNLAATTALAANSDIGYFESMDNISKLKSYTSRNVVSGDFLIEDEGKTANGNFEFAISTQMDNRSKLALKTKSNITGKMEVKLEGQDRPFNVMNVDFHAGLITMGKDGFFARIDSVNLDVQGLTEDDLQSYLDFKTELNDGISKVRGKWLHIPAKVMTSELDNELQGYGKLASPEEFRKSVTKIGLKGSIEKWIKDSVRQAKKEGSMSSEEADQALKVADRILNAKFFNLRTKSEDDQGGKTVSFILAKSKILDLVDQIGLDIGEPIPDEDRASLKDALSKFTLAGSYHVDSALRIFDLFRLKFSLKNVEMLKSLNLEFGTKISRANETDAVSKPAKFIEYDDPSLGFGSSGMPEEEGPPMIE